MQNQGKEEYYEIDLLHLIKVLWERVWLIILAAIIAGGVAFGYAHLGIKPLYQSSALFYVNNSSFSLGSTQLSISSAEISAAKSLVDTYIVILKSRTTLEDVSEKAGLNYGYEKLGSMVAASAVSNTEIFKVTVTSTDPKEAEAIANTICLVLPKTIANVVDGSDVRIVDYAVMSEKRVSPSYTKYAAIGAVIGVVLSAGYIVLSDFLDDMIHDTSDMTDKYDIPILAVIPNLNDGGLKDALCDKLSFNGAEAYKLLRANLMFALPGKGDRRVIGVTSAIRGEGKSTTAINLAYTLAQTGSNVLLIDADLRLPSISRRIGIDGEVGLSNYLAGLCDIYASIQPSRILKNLYVMPAGAIPPNPSELLASATMKNLIDSLSETIKYVVIDLPPVNVVSDALAISQIADGMLITVRQNYGDKKSLDACVNQLKLVNVKTAGFVFNDATEEGTHYGKYKKSYKYYKKYGYGYGYEKAQPADDKAQTPDDKAQTSGKPEQEDII